MRRRFREAFPDEYYETQTYHALCFREGCAHDRSAHLGWRVPPGPTIYLHDDEFHVHQRSWERLDGLDRLHAYVTAHAFDMRTNPRGNDYYLAPRHAEDVIEIMQAWLRSR